MGPSLFSSAVKKNVAGAVAVMFFAVQGVWGQRAESNFWSQRAEMSRRLRQGTGLSESGPLAHLPEIERVVPTNGPSVSGHWESVLGSHGLVRDVQRGEGPTVFFVQDVHGHRTAQENIAEIVLSFLSRYPHAPVVLEGAAGPISLAHRRVPSAITNRQVAAFFFNTGIISGAEYAVWSAPVEPAVFGGEDAALYKKNRAALHQASLVKPSLEKQFKKWQARLGIAKGSVFSSELKEFDLNRARWATGEGFADKVSYLAKTDRLDPPRPGSALSHFVEILSLEKSLSLDQVARDRTVFIDRLSRALTPTETNDLTRAALSLRAGEHRAGAFYEKLRKLAERKGIPLQNYPDFNTYVRYILWVDQIRPEILHQELEEREEELWLALAKTNDQKKLHILDRDMGLLGGLLNLELTPAQWGLFKERQAQIDQISNRLSAFGLSSGDSASADNTINIEPFKSFYEAAESRNNALVKNVLAAQNPSSRDTPILLVAGGFHSEGVSRLLSAQKAGWVTVAPRFSTAEDAPGAFGLFYRDRTPLELLFDSPRVTLSETLAIAPVTQDPRSEVVRKMAKPLQTALDDLAGPGQRRVVSGEALVVVRDRDAPPLFEKGARPVAQDVPAEIGRAARSAPLVSVYEVRVSPLRRLLELLKRKAGKVMGVALLGLFLIPFTGSPEAHAYTVSQGPQGVQVMVKKGEHLWGAATQVLKARGIEKPSAPEINRTVKDIAENNGIKNPDLIQPGVAYRVPADPESKNRSEADTDPKREGLSEPPAQELSPQPPTDPQPEKSDSKGFASLLWGIALAIGVPFLTSTPVRDAVRKSLGRITPMVNRVLVPGTLYAGGIIGLGVILSGGLPPGAMDSVISYLAAQWRMELVLSTGLAGAIYLIWFRAKDINLAPIEQSEPRLREWNLLLDRMKDSRTISEEDLSRLVNNLHALVLNNRITGSAVSDRAVLERRIDVYRALSRLSQKTVSYVDRQLTKRDWPAAQADRLRDVREKFFLYQLYGVKVSNALVPASVAHWALSNYDRENSWFERRKVGRLLRMVRGIPAMIRVSVREYTERLLVNEPRKGQTLWDQAEGLSVVGLGNILAPGLYLDSDKKELATIFDRLIEKTKTKELPDMSAKDLHRKGWGTLISVLIWAVAVTQMMSLIPAVLAFISGLGATMVLFRFQAWGVRRDGFSREGIALWREMNLRPHVNGRMNGNGAGEDPFHLNRDFARLHFNAAQEALSAELDGAKPSADVVLLLAQNESEREFYEKKSNDRTLFRGDVPVVVLLVPEGKGSFYAYARAWTYLFSDELKSVQSRFPHLRGRSPWDLGVATLVSRSGSIEAMNKPLNELPVVTSRVGEESVGGRSIFDLALMNSYRATQGGQRLGQGAMVLRWSDRAYVGPVRVPQGSGVRLDSFWANREEMARYSFGAVIASLNRPIELIRRIKNGKTLKTLVKEHPTRVYDLDNDRLKQVQAFSGEGVYSFDGPGARAQLTFLEDVIRRTEALDEAPPLNLMTYFLVPMAMAQGASRDIGRKISVYFSGQGFLTDPLPEDVQRFNHSSANSLASLFGAGEAPQISLNAGFVDETIYVGAEDMDSEDDPVAVLPPGRSAIDTKRRLMFSAFRNLTAAVIVSFGFIVSALSASNPTLSRPPSAISINRASPSDSAMPISSPLERRPGKDFQQNLGRTLETLRSKGLMNPEAERFFLSLMEAIPLEGRLTDNFAPIRVRTNDPSVSGTAVRIIDQTAQTSLGFQISEAWETHQRDHRPEQEMVQTAFLLGLAGIPIPTNGKAHPLLGPLSQLFGTSDGDGATTAWDEGVAAREGLLRSATGASIPPVDNETVVLRVTELLDPNQDNESRRAALIAKLRERAERPHESQGSDILLVNGIPGLTAEMILRDLRRDLPTTLHGYLASCELMLIGKDELTLADVRANLSLYERSGRSLDLYTADSSAIVVDPRRDDSSCRVLLLEWLGGQLKTLDVLGLARAALETARVVSTKA